MYLHATLHSASNTVLHEINVNFGIIEDRECIENQSSDDIRGGAREVFQIFKIHFVFVLALKPKIFKKMHLKSRIEYNQQRIAKT